VALSEKHRSAIYENLSPLVGEDAMEAWLVATGEVETRVDAAEERRRWAERRAEDADRRCHEAEMARLRLERRCRELEAYLADFMG
jgi:hypothetical protein